MIWTSVLMAALVGQIAGTRPASSNPLLPTGADPHAIIVGKTLWIYPTFYSGRDPSFSAYRSDDLVTFEKIGPILRLADVGWIKDDGNPRHHAWAPCMVERGGTFFFYYSVGNQERTPSRIGVATGPSPQGPFTDSGRPLVNDGAKGKFEAIDPDVFLDRDGKAYLLAGGSNGAKLRMWELNDDLLTLRREITIDTPPDYTEGPFLHERDGTYYLSYSGGQWQSSSYCVHYATSKSPTGPFEYRGKILESNDRHKGPGHHSIVVTPGGTFIVYHRWNERRGDGPYRGPRCVCIDRVTYGGDGSIKPIVMDGETIPRESFWGGR